MDHTSLENISLLIHSFRYLISFLRLPLPQFCVSFPCMQKSCILVIQIVFWIWLGWILCVCKKDGFLMLAIGYGARNGLTIPNKWPLPLISQLLDTTRGGQWFTKWDGKNRLNLIRVGAGHEWKTAIGSKKELFKYTVLPFGWTNAPATLQAMMSTIFTDEEGCV